MLKCNQILKKTVNELTCDTYIGIRNLSKQPSKLTVPNAQGFRAIKKILPHFCGFNSKNSNDSNNALWKTCEMIGS